VKYDALIITNLPNYYKINLFNEIAKERNIHVLFISENERRRNQDFLGIEMISGFDHDILSKKYNGRNPFSTCKKLFRLIKSNTYSSLILGEWVSVEYWFTQLFFKKRHTSMMLESSIDSINGIGPKELVKKVFLSQVSKIYANGRKHADLARYLGFKGEILDVKGLGIINYGKVEKSNRRSKDFLYVGRLSEEKNLNMLIDVFNELALVLKIIGEGPLRKTLQSKAGETIEFLGYIANKKMGSYFQSVRALILPSIHEPYGLVAEEALYYETPSIVSSACGIENTLCFDGVNSIVINSRSKIELKNAVSRMLDDDHYDLIKENCKSEVILEKNRQMVNTYCSTIEATR